MKWTNLTTLACTKTDTSEEFRGQLGFVYSISNTVLRVFVNSMHPAQHSMVLYSYPILEGGCPACITFTSILDFNQVAELP